MSTPTNQPWRDPSEYEQDEEKVDLKGMTIDNPFGMYEISPHGIRANIFWGKQREAIVKRLRNFANYTERLQRFIEIVDEAKRNNPNNLPF